MATKTYGKIAIVKKVVSKVVQKGEYYVLVHQESGCAWLSKGLEYGDGLVEPALIEVSLDVAIKKLDEYEKEGFTVYKELVNPATSQVVKHPVNEPLLSDDNLRENMEYVPIDSIKLWADNTNTHTEESLVRLGFLIKKYGQYVPLVVWKKDRQIRKGNGTYMAMKKLGLKGAWVVWKDFISKAEADAMGTADNEASKWSEVNQDQLRSLFLREDMTALTGGSRKTLSEFTGFTEQDIAGILMEPDFEKINNIKSKDDNDITATIKVICNPEDIKEIREILQSWSIDCGYEVEVK